jgi:hypothetical protein
LNKKGTGTFAKNINNFLNKNWLIEPEYSSIENVVTSKNPLSHMREFAYPIKYY